MEFRITEQVERTDEEEVLEGLMAYNRPHFADAVFKELGIYLEDGQGKKTAGLVGFTHGNWLHIKYLWVSEALRGQGIGSRILRTAEKTARERGCRFSFLDTFQFQAPRFYERYGYRQVFVLEECPRTGKHYYMVKELEKETDRPV